MSEESADLADGGEKQSILEDDADSNDDETPGSARWDYNSSNDSDSSGSEGDEPDDQEADEAGPSKGDGDKNPPDWEVAYMLNRNREVESIGDGMQVRDRVTGETYKNIDEFLHRGRRTKKGIMHYADKRQQQTGYQQRMDPQREGSPTSLRYSVHAGGDEGTSNQEPPNDLQLQASGFSRPRHPRPLGSDLFQEKVDDLTSIYETANSAFERDDIARQLRDMLGPTRFRCIERQVKAESESRNLEIHVEHLTGLLHTCVSEREEAKKSVVVLQGELEREIERAQELETQLEKANQNQQKEFDLTASEQLGMTTERLLRALVSYIKEKGGISSVTKMERVGRLMDAALSLEGGGEDSKSDGSLLDSVLGEARRQSEGASSSSAAGSETLHNVGHTGTMTESTMSTMPPTDSSLSPSSSALLDTTSQLSEGQAGRLTKDLENIQAAHAAQSELMKAITASLVYELNGQYRIVSEQSIQQLQGHLEKAERHSTEVVQLMASVQAAYQQRKEKTKEREGGEGEGGENGDEGNEQAESLEAKLAAAQAENSVLTALLLPAPPLSGSSPSLPPLSTSTSTSALQPRPLSPSTTSPSNVLHSTPNPVVAALHSQASHLASQITNLASQFTDLRSVTSDLTSKNSSPAPATQTQTQPQPDNVPTKTIKNNNDTTHTTSGDNSIQAQQAHQISILKQAATHLASKLRHALNAVARSSANEQRLLSELRGYETAVGLLRGRVRRLKGRIREQRERAELEFRGVDGKKGKGEGNGDENGKGDDADADRDENEKRQGRMGKKTNDNGLLIKHWGFDRLEPSRRADVRRTAKALRLLTAFEQGGLVISRREEGGGGGNYDGR